MGKRRGKKNKIPCKKRSIPQLPKDNWEISEEDKQIFLEAVDSLKTIQEDFREQKFDLIEDKPFIRKKKSSYRETGEQTRATIDLHGLRRKEAITLLVDFCRRSAGQGFRTVLVVTGKGIHSEDMQSVLKREVIRWLHSEKGRQLVKFYRFGSRHEGGKGVLILYLC